MAIDRAYFTRMHEAVEQDGRESFVFPQHTPVDARTVETHMTRNCDRLIAPALGLPALKVAF